MVAAAVASRVSFAQPAEFGVNNTLLIVRVVGTHESSSFSIPLPLILHRELEMKGAALALGISAAQWSGSMLYKRWKYDDETSFTLYPERECMDKNYSSCMIWQGWLTEMIQTFYSTGKLQVPDACRGFDLLLALEFFGILYQPEQLVFETFQAYSRVRKWSDFFTHRDLLADWIVDRLHGENKRLFGTAQNATAGTMRLGKDIVIPFDGGLVRTGAKGPSSAAVVYSFFNAKAQEKGSAVVAEDMRMDFCFYLQNVLGGVVRVTFPLKKVELISDQGKRQWVTTAVLIVEFTKQQQAPNKQRFTLSTPNRSNSRPFDEEASNKSPDQVINDIYRQLDDHDEDVIPPAALARAKTRSDALSVSAPISVIRAETNKSTTSVVTGPFFVDEDGAIRDVNESDEDVRALALRQEWIQGTLLNRDISKRVRELLHAEEGGGDNEETLLSAPVAMDRNTTFDYVKEAPCSVMGFLESLLNSNCDPKQAVACGPQCGGSDAGSMSCLEGGRTAAAVSILDEATVARESARESDTKAESTLYGPREADDDMEEPPRIVVKHLEPENDPIDPPVEVPFVRNRLHDYQKAVSRKQKLKQVAREIMNDTSEEPVVAVDGPVDLDAPIIDQLPPELKKKRVRFQLFRRRNKR